MTWIMKPYPLHSSSLITTPNTGSVALVADAQPKVVWEAATPAGGWTVTVDIDLFANRSLDTFAALFHSGAAGGLWRIYARTQAQGPSPAFYTDDPATLVFDFEGWGSRPRSADGVLQELRAHALRTLPAAISRRYLRIYFYKPSNLPDALFFRLGVLAIGERLEPGRDAAELAGFDWGAGRRINDHSTVHRLPGGEQSSWRGAKVAEVKGVFSHLTDAELDRMWAIVRAAGNTEPVLLCEAPDTLGAASLADRLHYGTLQNTDFFDRRSPSKTRIELRVLEML